MIPSNCANCDEPVVTGANFCTQCGQTTHLHRINLGHLFHEVVHFFTHADKGIFLLIGHLATRPGNAIKEYLAGKRKKYFSPLNFFLLAVGLFVFVQTTLKPMSRAVDLSALRAQVKQHPDPVVRERRLVKVDRQERAVNFIGRNSNIINFALVPVAALLFFLFFRKAGFNYAEHVVAHLYIAGFDALFFVFIITPYLLLTGGTPYYLWGVGSFMLFEITYRALAYYYLLPRRGTMAFLRVFFVSALVVLLWFVFSTFFIQLYVNTGFQ